MQTTTKKVLHENDKKEREREGHREGERERENKNESVRDQIEQILLLNRTS